MTEVVEGVEATEVDTVVVRLGNSEVDIILTITTVGVEIEAMVEIDLPPGYKTDKS